MFKKYDAYILGYYGMLNAGDDALMAASMWAAEHALGCTSVCVSSKHEIEFGDIRLPATLHSEQQYKGQNRLLHYKHAARSRRVIIGGGSVFHTANDIQQKRHMIALANRKQSAAVGVSLGPFKDSEAERACRAFLNECGFVGVRDVASFDIARSLAPTANVDLTFDLAPTLLCHDRLTLNKGQRAGILVNVCPVEPDLDGKVDEQREDSVLTTLAKQLAEVAEATNERITLLSMNGHPLYGDSRPLRKLQNLLAERVSVSVIPYHSDPIKLIEVISHFKAIVSMRLHGNVFGYLAGTPTISLNYHKKCNQWCDQISLPEAHRIGLESHQLQSLAQPLLNGIQDGFEPAGLAVENAVKKSLSNWSMGHESSKLFCHYSAV